MTSRPDRVVVDVGPLSEPDVLAVARGGAGVELSPAAAQAISESRRVIEALATDTVPHYGISTGFGALATTSIPPERRAASRENIRRLLRP